jgi:hypothetical protein
VNICEEYIKLIKNTNRDPIDILKKHNYVLNYSCAIDLSRYYDSIDYDIDSKFMIRLNRLYNISEDYLKEIDLYYDYLINFLQGEINENM